MFKRFLIGFALIGFVVLFVGGSVWAFDEYAILVVMTPLICFIAHGIGDCITEEIQKYKKRNLK